ncbi:Fc.00g009670.m01.CDS01 [Cosmosporella sp. VM-42]
MSKQPLPDDEELPPPYEYSPTVSTPVTSPTSLPSLLSSHLNNLPLRILSAQAARTSARDQHDSEVLGLVVPHMEALLSSIAAMDPPPRLVEMTMVPEEAVGEEWAYSDEDKRRSVVRVRRDIKIDGDRKKPVESEPERPKEKAFDEWGRWGDDARGSSTTQESCLWWSDRDMAIRLANHLQPKRVDRRTVKAHVEQAKEVKKAGRWSLFKKAETPPPPPTPPRVKEEEEDVSMTVNAEEVTFRRENELGIWESTRGWGLVVKVRVKQ